MRQVAWSVLRSGSLLFIIVSHLGCSSTRHSRHKAYFTTLLQINWLNPLFFYKGQDLYSLVLWLQNAKYLMISDVEVAIKQDIGTRFLSSSSKAYMQSTWLNNYLILCSVCFLNLPSTLLRRPVIRIIWFLTWHPRFSRSSFFCTDQVSAKNSFPGFVTLIPKWSRFISGHHHFTWRKFCIPVSLQNFSVLFTRMTIFFSY